jgi:hypothetical protein
MGWNSRNTVWWLSFLMRAVSFLVATTLFPFSWNCARAQLLSGQVGISCDHFGYQYVLLAEDTVSVLDEQQASIRMDYVPLRTDRNQLDLSNTLYYGSNSIRDRLGLRWQLGSYGSNRLTVENEAEWRRYHPSGDMAGSGDYLLNEAEVEAEFVMPASMVLGISHDLDVLSYQTEPSYGYDYMVNTQGMSLRHQTGLEGSLEFEGEYRIKSVPDSARMETHSPLGRVTFTRWFGWTTVVDAEAELERETYPNDPDSDAWNGQVRLDVNREVNRWEFDFNGEVESWSYDHQDEVNVSSIEPKLSLITSYGLTDYLRVGAGPAVSMFLPRSSLYQEERYRSFGAETQVEYLKLSQLWGDLTIEVGRRDYTDVEGDDALYSDFTYLESTLLATWTIYHPVELSVFATYDQEWHDQADHDVSTRLVSADLRYQF